MVARSSRLQRQVAAARASYERDNAPDVRADLEAGLLAAAQSLTTRKRLSPATETELKRAVGMIVSDGVVGGAWWKVHSALAEEWPELYRHVKDVLPDARTGDQPFSL
jgi:hypothetical protein